jgi:hypothetical protein
MSIIPQVCQPEIRHQVKLNQVSHGMFLLGLPGLDNEAFTSHKSQHNEDYDVKCNWDLGL